MDAGSAASVVQHATPEEWDEWLTLYASRNDLAETYAAWLRLEDSAWPGWAEFNAAILRRWSPAALRYVKERAWKIANQDL